MFVVEISKYLEHDLNAIVDLFLDTVHVINRKDYTEEQLDAWAPYDEKERIKKSWQVTLREHISYVAKCEHQLVGFADMTLDGRIQRVYVHKDYQDLGIAKNLLQELEGEAYQLGLITLATDASITSVPFFKKQGFTVVAEKNVLRKDIILRNFSMEKEL